MCQHGHLDTSILAYLGSRGLLTHFEGNGGIFKAKQAIHRGTAMFICYLSFCGQVRKRSGWIDSGMTFILFLQQNWAKMMDRWTFSFLFVNQWRSVFSFSFCFFFRNLIQWISAISNEAITHNFTAALQWKELKTLRLQTRDSALALRRGFSCLCLIPSALVRVGRYGWMHAILNDM